MIAPSSALTASLLGLATLAQANTLVTPKNGYLGNLASTITCKVFGIDFTLNGTFAATAPFVLEEGQEFNANDIAVTLDLPSILTTGAPLLGVDHVDVKLFTELEFTNVSPALYNPFPEGRWFNGTKVNPSSKTIRVPSTGVLGGFGPLKAGMPGQDTLVYLGDTTAELHLYSKAGKPILGAIKATCPAPKYNALLATFNVVPATSPNPPLLDVKDGFLPAYPPVARDTQYGCFDFQYDCDTGMFGTLPLETVVCGVAGGIYPEGSTYYLSNVTSDLFLPADLVAAIPNVFPGTVSADYVVNNINVRVTNALPSTANGVPSGGIKGSLDLSKPGQATLSVPQTGALEFGPFKVTGQAGQTVFIYIEDTSSHFTYKDAAGKATGQLDITCKPHVSNLTVIGVTISPEGAPRSQVGI